MATRLAQLETGELDFADDMNLDQYDRIRGHVQLTPIVAKPYIWLAAVLNKKEGKVPSIRYGDLHGLRAARKTVKGFNERKDRPRFQNVGLER